MTRVGAIHMDLIGAKAAVQTKLITAKDAVDNGLIPASELIPDVVTLEEVIPATICLLPEILQPVT